VTDFTEIQAGYRGRRDDFAAAEQRCARRDRWLTHLRTAAFFGAAALFGLGWLDQHQRGWYLAGGLFVTVFLALVAYHEHLLRQLQRYRLLRQINQQALARLERDWTNLPEVAVEVPAKHQSVASDLDLFGHASLFHFLCSANTPTGQQVLRDWLLEPASPDEIPLRQQAVADLAPRIELRETLNVEGRLLGDRGEATERFILWAESSPWLAARPWLLWLCRLLPGTIVLAMLLALIGVLPAEYAVGVVLVALSMNLLVSVLFLADVHEIFAQLNARGGKVRRYLTMFELMYSLPASAGELETIKREATQRGGGVLLRLRELSWISGVAGISRSALFFIFVYLPLQFVFLYDFHVLNLLEGWQRRYGTHARQWFAALGKFEALSSLAVLAHDYPDWALPRVSSAAPGFEAEQLGHPLLPDRLRVVNDVALGPPGSFLLVTGSNMSGKSTLLRAIGVNAVLAGAGAAVCARRLVMPPVVLGTSMRVRDSLEFGVSFYMAELMRLKEIVDRARSLPRTESRRLLYLLDEILQGTNSRERHIAVVRVLHHLLEHDAIGAVSTHDLELSTSELLKDASRCVHFRETLHDHDAARPMTFDYRLRPGVATTTNALKLLELVGLGDAARDPQGGLRQPSCVYPNVAKNLS
jgi:hypothetical protein